MSAHPKRIEWQATVSGSGSPLQEGNRVLETIAQREALRALLAYSDLHEQIQSRRSVVGHATDQDLFETERFILDEVLQLICNRVQAITLADGIVIALAEGPAAESNALEPNKDHQKMVCRAAAGPLTTQRGVHLIAESEFLQDCLESGRVLRCDNCEIDSRVELDFSRTIGARSTVLVPLRGRNQQLGVLQAFSTTARAFSDHDVRSFDLFAELVLSALRPEDQDRRIYWLSDLAGDVLEAKPAAENEASSVSIVEPMGADEAVIETAEDQALEEDEDKDVVESAIASSAAPAMEMAAYAAIPIPEPDTELGELAQPVAIPAARIELPDLALGELALPRLASYERESQARSVADESVDIPFENEEPETFSEAPRFLSFPQPISRPGSSRPGLNVVLGLVAVAALFSAGAWWGMQVHGKAVGRKAMATVPRDSAVQNSATQNSSAKTSPPSAPTPPAPSEEEISLEVSDNLMNPEKAGSSATPLTAISADKLAALPKITSVRHWSSSLGSTVVIDMEDQVPYEVHRLMSPERIYFDLHDTVLPAELAGKTIDVGDASLSRVRVAQPVAGVTRIVLDTKDGSNFSVSMESNPYRLVVELRASEKPLAASRTAPSRVTPIAAPSAPASATALASLDKLATPAKSAPVVALVAKAIEQPLPAKTGKFRIVLDAGHGGWDLGTVGRQGLLEKDLVLDVTQRLGRLLQSRLGSEVMFTRSSDTYLPLDQRADMANQSQADLFVSVHANYSSSTTARGVETYYTNLFSAPGSREVEKHDDGSFAKLTPVAISAEGLHEKIEESRRLAASIQRSLYSTLAANSPDIRDRGIKDSAFAVLTGTTMPSILTEISFVSSPADEHNLQSATYRQQIAEALFNGIARYKENSPRAKVAQLQTARR